MITTSVIGLQVLYTGQCHFRAAQTSLEEFRLGTQWHHFWGPTELRWFPLALQLLWCEVCLEVLADMVAACEPLLTVRAFKALVTCVRACVPLQLIAAGEPLSTESPVAHEWPLPGVQTNMGSQE